MSGYDLHHIHAGPFAPHQSGHCGWRHRHATENPREAIRLGISEPRIGRGAA